MSFAVSVCFVVVVLVDWLRPIVLHLGGLCGLCVHLCGRFGSLMCLAIVVV
jgi:hypothetical protein